MGRGVSFLRPVLYCELDFCIVDPRLARQRLQHELNFETLTLRRVNTMPTIGWIVVVIVAIAAGIGGGYFIGYNNRKKTAEAQIGSG